MYSSDVVEQASIAESMHASYYVEVETTIVSETQAL